MRNCNPTHSNLHAQCLPLSLILTINSTSNVQSLHLHSHPQLTCCTNLVMNLINDCLPNRWNASYKLFELANPAEHSSRRMVSGGSVVLDPAAPGSRKLPSSLYKGVVPQPNGRWGAQIYERHKRVWLGTFVDGADAARAYDVAAQRFRGRDAITNFRSLDPSDNDEAAELAFLAGHSKAEVVDMLRKHTYGVELEQSKRACAGGLQATRGGQRTNPSFPRSAREMLFDKVVTPSDVGKLNRLVVPKQHAETHFPLKRGGGVDMACRGVLLNFVDGGGRAWRFRYSYWNSIWSYVLTKGWSRFVKEKKLKAGDVVSFWRTNAAEQHLYIDCKHACAVDFFSVRLFGVEISEAPSGGADTKRSAGEMELFTRSNPSNPRSSDL